MELPDMEGNQDKSTLSSLLTSAEDVFGPLPRISCASPAMRLPCISHTSSHASSAAPPALLPRLHPCTSPVHLPRLSRARPAVSLFPRLSSPVARPPTPLRCTSPTPHLPRVHC